MAVLYHSTHGNTNIPEGAPYRGSFRDALSEFMGGPVGFAYAFLPPSWVAEDGRAKPGIYEIIIPDDEPILVARPGWDVPRHPAEYYNPPLNWDTAAVIVTAAEAATLPPTYGEVVFRAEAARFGRHRPAAK